MSKKVNVGKANLTQFDDVVAAVEISADLWRCICKCGSIIDSPISLLEQGIGTKCRHNSDKKVLSGGRDPLDRYYTPAKLAVEVVDKVMELIPDSLDREWIEPSAGMGVFLDIMQVKGIECSGYDIDPELNDPRITKQDFLKLDSMKKGSIIIGNPPYGKISSTAVKFVNHSVYLGAEYVAFVLPISWSKPTILPRINKRLHLIYSQSLPSVEYQQIDGTMSRPHERVLQIWQLRNQLRVDDSKYAPKRNPWILFTTFQEEADLFVRRVGKGIGDIIEESGNINYNTTLYLSVKEPYVKEDIRIAIKSVQNDLYMDSLKTEIIPSLSQVELINRLTQHFEDK